MDEITQIQNRLKIIHNETACAILQKMIEQKKEPEVFLLDEIRSLTNFKESTLLINLKNLVKGAFLLRPTRGTYELTFEGKNIISILRELDKKAHLEQIRKYKRPEIIFMPLFSSKGSFSTKDLTLELSRASAYRILNELTDLEYLIKSENNTWGLTKKFEDLKNILLQKKELSNEILKRMDQIQKYIQNEFPNVEIIIVISTIEGLLIYPEIDENLEFFRISSVASAEVNIAINLERVSETRLQDSTLRLIINQSKEIFSIIRSYNELNLILIVKGIELSKFLPILPNLDEKMRFIRENLL